MKGSRHIIYILLSLLLPFYVFGITIDIHLTKEKPKNITSFHHHLITYHKAYHRHKHHPIHHHKNVHKRSPKNKAKPKAKNQANKTKQNTYKIATYTFKKLNLLSSDLVLKGDSYYTFYIPALRDELQQANINLIIKAPDKLRKISSVTIYVDDKPIKTLSYDELNKAIPITIIPNKYSDYVKLGIKTHLFRLKNICDDLMLRLGYILISPESTVSFSYTPYHDIASFLKGYENKFCFDNPEILPLSYYLSKINPMPIDIYYNDKIPDCKNITLFQNTKLSNNTLYLNKNDISLIESGYYKLLSEHTKIKYLAFKNQRTKNNELSLKELGIDTKTTEGTSMVVDGFNFNLSSFGDIPKNLHLVLHIAYTPINKANNPQIRIYLNNVLIKAYRVTSNSINYVDFNIPTDLLSYGSNYLSIGLYNFIASKNCYGSINHVALTVYNDSYFYYTGVSKSLNTISDFLYMLNGNVDIILEDNTLIPMVSNILNGLGKVNPNIEHIYITQKPIKDADYYIILKKPTWKYGLFEIKNPLTNKVVFSAYYRKNFVFFELKNKDRPALYTTYYGNGLKDIFNKYNIKDYLSLKGNIAIMTKDFYIPFETGKTLRIKYQHKKGLDYYWDKYKLFIIAIVGVIASILFAHVYKKLTRRPQ